jgi:hypothetical protein
MHMSPGAHVFSSSPSKSIRTQIENAAAYPEGYAERAKLVYQTADQERWSREHTLEMLKDPAKFARFVEIVSYLPTHVLFIQKKLQNSPASQKVLANVPVFDRLLEDLQRRNNQKHQIEE